MKFNLEQLSTSLGKGVLYRKFLIFGPEESVAAATLNTIITQLKQIMGPDINIEHLQYSAIKDNMATVNDGLKSRSLFGGQKVIIINNVSGAPVKELVKIYKNDLQHGTIITMAGDLSKTSALRKIAEEAKDIVASICYKPDLKSIHILIKRKLFSLGLSNDNAIVSMIADLLPADQLIIYSELEKLALYKDTVKQVTAEDITACFSYSGDTSLDDLIYAIVSKEQKMRAKQLKRLLYSDINFMLVIRSLLNFFNKLLQVHANAVAAGSNPQSQVPSLRPPLFFKSRDNMMLACNAFSANQTKAIISRLVELERRCKSGTMDNKLLLQHFLLRAI